MKLSIIIPVYKGENTIVPLFSKIQETLDRKYDYEVLFINDNAVDNSWEKIKRLSINNPIQVKGYRLKKNYGQHKAIMFGFKEASGEYLVTMDEDIQHEPAYIPEMLAFLIDNELDIVYGDFVKFRKNGLRRIGSGLGRKIAARLIPHLYKGYSPFRIVRTEIVRSLDFNNKVAFIDGQLGSVTDKIGEYPIEHFQNKRPSSYTFLKLVLLGFSIVSDYSRLARAVFLILLISTLIISVNVLAGIADWNLDFLSIIILSFVLTLCASILSYALNRRSNNETEIVEKVGRS